MKNRIVCMFLTLVMVVGLFSGMATTAFAAETPVSGKTADGLVYDAYESYIEITDYTGLSVDVIVPEFIEGKPVTIIGFPAFTKTDVETVDFPKTITTVDFAAFKDCYNLEKITIAGSLNGHCTHLTDKDGNYGGDGYFVRDGVLFCNTNEYMYLIDSSVATKKLNHNILVQYPAAKEGAHYTIPSDTMELDVYAFYSPKTLQSITIPASVNRFLSMSITFRNEPHEKPTTFIFQHNEFPNNISTGAIFDALPGSKIIVKNEEVKTAFEANYDTLLHHSKNTNKIDIVAQETPTTSLSADMSELNLKVGESKTVFPKQLPYNTTDNLIYTSSDESVVEFDRYNRGIATAKRVGTATLSVSSGSVSQTVNITTTCEHQFASSWTIDKTATCTEPGLKSRHCTLCDEKTDITGIPVIEHNFTNTRTYNLNGKTNTAYYCSACKAMLPDIEMISGVYITETGIKLTWANTLSKYDIYRSTNPTTKNWEKISTITNNRYREFIDTDVVDGETYHYCVVPTNGITITPKFTYYSSIQYVAPTYCDIYGHNYVGSITEPPTCTDTGIKTFTCYQCGDIYTEVVNALGHKPVIDAAVSPTCTCTGKTQGSHCSVCNVVIVKQNTINATGHKGVVDPAVSPTCTNPGKTEGSHCSICNTVIKSQQIVNATGHSFSGASCTKCGAKNPNYTNNPTTSIPATPDMKKVANVPSGVKVTWGAVDGADSYRVYRRGAGQSWKYIETVEGTSYTDTSIKNNSGALYRYTVRAANNAGLSNYESGLVIRYVATPDVKRVSNTRTGVKVTWDAVKGADSYRVYRRGAGQSWKYIKTVKGTSYTDSTIKNNSGNLYRYTVRTVDNKKYSAYESGLVIRYVATPHMKKAVNTSKGISVSWNDVSGADAYRVYRRGVGGSWKLVATVKGNRFVDTAVKNNFGTLYRYTVRAVDSNKLSAYESGLVIRRGK